ncbi:MAG: hypothetical protein HQ541_23400 [Mariniphaga sp.]|nr:hypothetical protein [Mariniphaga sp.]
MKTYIKKQLANFILLIAIAVLINGCNGFFDPIEDQETGKDITLLILDMNFFSTRVTYKFIDAKEGFLITSPATISFSGKNATDIVTFGGEKNSEYNTSVGELELTIDPNVDISENNPFEFAVNANIEGYSTMSKGVQFRNTGIKTVEVHMSKLSDQNVENLDGESDGDTTFIFLNAPFSKGLKSATADAGSFNIVHSTTVSNIRKFRDRDSVLLFSSIAELMDSLAANPTNFISLSTSSFSDYSPWIDVLNIGGTSHSVIFHLLETGTLTGITVLGTPVGYMGGGVITSNASYTGTPSPDYFGFADLLGSSYFLSGTSKTHSTLASSYKLIKASDEDLCPTGTSITFESSVISSFSVTADVYDRQDPPELITTINFTGNFPEEITVENTPPIPVTLVFRDDNPSFKPIPDLEIENFCLGTPTVYIEPQDGFDEYQIVLKAYCPSDETFAFAPTYSGEFRIAESDDPWQGTSMIGGVVDLLGLPNQEYEYRLLWKNEHEYTSIWTEFNVDGSYSHVTDSRSITSKPLPDGRIQISVEHDFKQSVCDGMGWIN